MQMMKGKHLNQVRTKIYISTKGFNRGLKVRHRNPKDNERCLTKAKTKILRNRNILIETKKKN